MSTINSIYNQQVDIHVKPLRLLSINLLGEHDNFAKKNDKKKLEDINKRAHDLIVKLRPFYSESVSARKCIGSLASQILGIEDVSILGISDVSIADRTKKASDRIFEAEKPASIGVLGIGLRVAASIPPPAASKRLVPSFRQGLNVVAKEEWVKQEEEQLNKLKARYAQRLQKIVAEYKQILAKMSKVPVAEVAELYTSITDKLQNILLDLDKEDYFSSHPELANIRSRVSEKIASIERDRTQELKRRSLILQKSGLSFNRTKHAANYTNEIELL